MLEQRTLTDKGIFYTPGGLPRAERELAATVASKINGCIYCASVHARKAAQLAKDETAIETLLAVTPGEQLSDGQTPGWQAQIDFAAAISVTPPALSVDHLAAVEQQGLDTLARLDLLQSAAFFAWANRLMLTLGDLAARRAQHLAALRILQQQNLQRCRQGKQGRAANKREG